MAAKINLRTGKIIGAEEGTFAWYHEKGHLVYDNSARGIINGVNQNMSMLCSFIFLVLGQWLMLFSILAVFSVVYMVGLTVYEELWCNAYAREQLMLKNKKEKEKGGKNKNGTKRN
jgi:hypothetical protein